MSLPDIRNQFRFWTSYAGQFTYKNAEGDLGVPGQVATFRSRSAQTGVSHGTGEHAGHLIGTQFGAPGDAQNLGLQNPNMNSFAPKALQDAFRGAGGSYHRLESDWKRLLQQGYRIHVKIQDKYRQGENRPFSRSVQWTQTAPNGGSVTNSLEFGNFSSPQQRNAAGG